MHHASHRLGRGYCTFNDVAIAIAALRADGLASRVLILDLDVHQGDGNAEFYAHDPDTVVVSIHGARNYPFTRPPSDLDIDLPDGTADEGYLAALAEALAFAHGPRAVRPGDADRRGRPVCRRCAGAARRSGLRGGSRNVIAGRSRRCAAPASPSA